MNDALMEFIKLNIPKITAGGFCIGGFMGAIATITGYAIKQVLGLFDK